MLPKKEPSSAKPSRRCVTRLSQTSSGVRRIVWRNATAAVVLVLAYLPLTAGLLEEGWSGPHYKFVPLALLCAGVLTMRAWRQPGLAQAQSEHNSRDAVLLGMAWATLLVAILAWSPALGAVSALLLVIALVDGRGGWPLLRRYTPALALLCLAIPLPHSVVLRLSLGFQSLVTRGAATVLDRLAVPNLRSGIILELADRQCLVDEAASGADGVLLVLVITMFYAFSARRSALSIVVLLAAAALLGYGGRSCPRCRCRLLGGPAGREPFARMADRRAGTPRGGGDPGAGLEHGSPLVGSGSRLAALSFLDSSTNPASSRGDPRHR